MSNIKKILSLLLVFGVLLSVAACGGTAGTTGNSEPTVSPSGSNPSQPSTPTTGATTNYQVNVTAVGGRPLSGIVVQVYEDDTLEELANAATTDSEGVANLSLPRSDKYAIVLAGLSEGYKREVSYSFTGNTANITLQTELIADKDLSGAKFEVGDIMYDFELTDVDGSGTTYKLSEILKEKNAVVINFFYTGCNPCRSEMPYMQEVYETYGDKVEIIAINPQPGATETAAYSQAFAESMGLTFPVCKSPSGWASITEAPDPTNPSSIVTQFPTTMIVDKYGVVCLLERGSVTSRRPWVGMMQHFSADDYQQKLCTNGFSDLITQVKPTVENESVEDLGNVLGTAGGNIIYSNQEEDAEYTWPFVIGEKLGETVVYASNATYESSYAIMNTQVTLKKGEGFGFDYLVSSESGADFLHVTVNNTLIYSISGYNVAGQEIWETAYPWVAEEDGVYDISFIYMKDDSDPVDFGGEDTVYLKNMRIVANAATDIDVQTYLPREAAKPLDEYGLEFKYETIVYNEEDGYYHVWTEDGPILLANLRSFSQLWPKIDIYNMALNEQFVINGHDYIEELTPYASYAANSPLQYYSPVTEELKQVLEIIVELRGNLGTPEEWLQVCRYYEAFGTNGEQFADPIEGLATFSAIEGQVGMNYVSYNGEVIMPRGKLVKFVPTVSGVYRISTRELPENEPEYNAFIFEGGDWVHHNQLEDNAFYSHEPDERNYYDYGNLSMVYYMEAGRAYYIDICFYDVYAAGTIPFEIEYVGESYEMFRLASPGYFVTAIVGGNMDAGNLIAGGIDVVLGEDGYYHEDLGNGKLGSILYADFSGTTPIWPSANLLLLIERGYFDFRYNEYDRDLLEIIESEGTSDRAVVEAALREQLGEDYEELVDNYKLDEFFAGIYHGRGGDETETMRQYAQKMIQSDGPENGCVPVDAELARILQLHMDTYIFEDVEYSWKKLCYFYDHFGPA